MEYQVSVFRRKTLKCTLAALVTMWLPPTWAMTLAEAQQQSREFDLTPSYLARWINVRQEAEHAGLDVGVFQLANPDTSPESRTPDRIVSRLEGLPRFAGILQRHGLSATDFMLGSHAILAGWVAQTSSAPESLAEPANIEAVRQAEDQLRPIMEHDFEIERQQRFKRREQAR